MEPQRGAGVAPEETSNTTVADDRKDRAAALIADIKEKGGGGLGKDALEAWANDMLAGQDFNVSNPRLLEQLVPSFLEDDEDGARALERLSVIETKQKERQRLIAALSERLSAIGQELQKIGLEGVYAEVERLVPLEKYVAEAAALVGGYEEALKEKITEKTEVGRKRQRGYEHHVLMINEEIKELESERASWGDELAAATARVDALGPLVKKRDELEARKRSLLREEKTLAARLEEAQPEPLLLQKERVELEKVLEDKKGAATEAAKAILSGAADFADHLSRLPRKDDESPFREEAVDTLLGFDPDAFREFIESCSTAGGADRARLEECWQLAEKGEIKSMTDFFSELEREKEKEIEKLTEGRLSLEAIGEIYREFGDSDDRYRYVEYVRNKLKEGEKVIREHRFDPKSRSFDMVELDLDRWIEEENGNMIAVASERFSRRFCANEVATIDDLEARSKDGSKTASYREFFARLAEHFGSMKESLEKMRASRPPELRKTVFDPETGTDTGKPLELSTDQLMGVKFMTERKRSMNADQMGMGKTLMTISSMLYGRSMRNLVVSPKTLVANWRSEIEKFTNVDMEKDVTVVEDLKSLKKAVDGMKERWDKQEKPMFILMNNDKLSGANRAAFQETLTQLGIDTLVVDEAHNFKAEESKRVEMLAGIEKTADKLHLLTGTPVVNEGRDLWNGLHMIDSETYGNLISEKEFEKMARDPEGILEISRRLRHVMLRREIEHYNPDIARINKVEREHRVEMTDLQERIYGYLIEKYRSMEKPAERREFTPKLMAMLNQLEVDPLLTIATDEYEDAETKDRAITLRENHLLTYMEQEDAERVFKTATLGEGGLLLQQTKREQRSNKYAVLRGIVDGMADDEQAVVYVESPFAAQMLADSLRDRDSVHISGKISQKERKDAVLDFQAGRKRVFVMNRVGGEGINLPKAKHMIFVDYPYTPALFDQIVSRVIRRGQTNDEVVVHRLMTKISDKLRLMAPEMTSMDDHNRVIMERKRILIGHMLKGLIRQEELAQLVELAKQQKVFEKYLKQALDTKKGGQ